MEKNSTQASTAEYTAQKASSSTIRWATQEAVLYHPALRSLHPTRSHLTMLRGAVSDTNSARTGSP